jgi:hypothetical protein
MASALHIANLGVNAEVDALTALLSNGYLRIYDGVQPASAETAITTQTLLAELRFGTPGWGAAVAGVATATAITSDTDANATGTASWFRAFKSDGTSAVLDGSVGTADADINLPSVAIQIHATVDVDALTYQRPK